MKTAHIFFFLQFLLLHSLFGIQYSFSQTPKNLSDHWRIDSLLSLLQKLGEVKSTSGREDTTRINYLNALCKQYHLIGQYDTALHYGNDALDLGKKINFPNGIAASYKNIGIIYWSKGNYPIVLEYFFKALKIYEELGNKNGIANTLSDIGIVYYNQPDYSKALEYYFKALKIMEESGNENGFTTILGNIGIVYMEQASIANPDSTMYRERLYNKALEYFFKALKTTEESGNKNNITANLNNIGSVYLNLGDYPKALEYFFKVLKMAEKIGAKSMIAINLGNIGSLYTLQKKYDEAEKYLLKALERTKEIGILNITRRVEELMSELYLAKGEYKKAYEHHRQWSIINDSLFNKEKYDDLTRKEMNYEFEKKEAVTAAAMALQKQKNKLNLVVFVASFLLLLLAFAGYAFYKLKEKQQSELAFSQQLIANTEEERSRIANDLHDDLSQQLLLVKNNLLNKNEQGSAEKIAESIATIRTISRELYPAMLEKVGLKIALEELLEKVDEQDAIFVIQELNYTEKRLGKQAELQLYRIIQEAVNNILKYAEAKTLRVELNENDKTVNLLIQDNGKGFNIAEKLKGKKSFGLYGMQRRAENINASIFFTSNLNEGTTIQVKIPVT